MNTNTQLPTFTSTEYAVGNDPKYGMHTTGVVTIYRRETFARATVSFDTVEQRDAAFAAFPKSVRVRQTSVSIGTGVEKPMISFEVSLRANGNNGGVNETGLKRLAAWDRVVAQLEIPVVEL